MLPHTVENSGPDPLMQLFLSGPVIDVCVYIFHSDNDVRITKLYIIR